MLSITVSEITEFGSAWLRVERISNTTGRVEALATFKLDGYMAERSTTVDVWDLALAVRDELESVTGSQGRL
jgi:hypothetical protein